MFTRRWTRWCAWVGAALVVALLITMPHIQTMVPRDSISLGNYKRIRLGMTQQEVIAIIGVQHANYLKEAVQLVGTVKKEGAWSPGGTGLVWSGVSAFITVQCDQDGKVAYKEFTRSAPTDARASFFTFVRDLLDW